MRAMQPLHSLVRLALAGLLMAAGLMWPGGAGADPVFSATANISGSIVDINNVTTGDQPTPQVAFAEPFIEPTPLIEPTPFVCPVPIFSAFPFIDPIPFVEPNPLVEPNPVVLSQALGFAFPGTVGGRYDSVVTQNDTGFLGNASGAFTGSVAIDDLIFTGPEPSVMVGGANFRFSGQLGAGSPANITNFANVSLSLVGPFGVVRGSTFLQANGAAAAPALVQSDILVGTGSLAGGVGNATWSVDTTLTTGGFTVLTGVPRSITMNIQTNGNAGVGVGNSGTGFTSADFLHSLSFVPGAPVFDLPAGFTVNSVQANIVDNRWLGLVVAVPEPSTLAIFGLGLAGLGFVRRRRRSTRSAVSWRHRAGLPGTGRGRRRTFACSSGARPANRRNITIGEILISLPRHDHLSLSPSRRCGLFVRRADRGIDATAPLGVQVYERARYPVDEMDFAKWFTDDEIAELRAMQDPYFRWLGGKGCA